jgi:hypothetical protein
MVAYRGRTDAGIDANEQDVNAAPNAITQSRIHNLQLTIYKEMYAERCGRFALLIVNCDLWIAMNWLFKEEPRHYGYDELVKDKKAVWNSITAPR